MPAEAGTPADGIRYVCPTSTLFASCLSEALAATIASRLARVFDPRNRPAILESVSPSTAVYFVIPVGDRDAELAGPLGALDPTLTISSPCCFAASRNAVLTFDSALDVDELPDSGVELDVAASFCGASLAVVVDSVCTDRVPLDGGPTSI